MLVVVVLVVVGMGRGAKCLGTSDDESGGALVSGLVAN